MAQNRRPELEPAHSSSDSEEEGSESELEGSESEQEDKTSPPTPPGTKKPSTSKKPATNQTPSVPLSSSSDDSQPESDSDSDSKTAKPVEDSSKSTKNPRSEPKSGAGSKRPAESEPKDSKRAKKEDDQKKQLFQRLWSEDDEIAILKGIMEYTSKKGADPMADMQAFYDFIKKSVHVDVTKNQLSAKVRRLKKKYENNANKEKGKDRTFSKLHEQKAYDLSKKIWGKKGNSTVGGEIDGSAKVNGPEKKNQNQRASSTKAVNDGAEKKNQKPKVERVSSADVKKEEQTVEIARNVAVAPSRPIEFSGGVSNVKFEEEIMKNGEELIKGDKKKELDEKWRKQRMLEIEVYLKRLALIREQMSLVLEALKSEGN